MSVKEKIEEDLVSAMKNRKELTLSVLRMLVAALRSRQTEKRTKCAKVGVATEDLSRESELTEDEVLETLRSEAKKRKDAIEGFEKGGRADMAARERQELTVLGAYLPAELSDAELHAMVSEALLATGAGTMKDFGKVMGRVMAQAKNRVSGDRVSAAVKEMLGAK
ncbi:MAG: hypothetical protein A3I44_03925 [Candidatus Sungbacteria bacterium RIFCSPLOWO2_02_FULL_51_17]|uniref:Glutamyl-tRNA amidotransferase n=1 Tax=Candidatus Sungbacteria bacterium RIFCSPHIGHO2_02_FULL_51_29 TaxID=1802273 RepID=A0A1G2KV10_9BACT|nr:MAG: hypothetical protein A2676_02445 [Candidatus Sungbacteria bacterium RIFCSPHIGHO2_01_FULL_51_22]OHA02249.1 MAG: hypothetical protein A3C16_04085 [Candidatus Sungbacteria bacterium RIFCSPHIGHO2_02_FULL_51_29]OHA06660.1 MAG: hypothetical protein A3B29_03060 [Candidatus Sungbacteria bacterium RIFCSPLOWO2_01_FULL_51_34]OHA11234.1 MAG: hypothetical protein A3I44_03925 [Candidatus Sungbacteria bacterium RIFCSPLOWO2_02_FULL_51_17]